MKMKALLAVLLAFVCLGSFAQMTSGLDPQLLKMVVSVEQMDSPTNAHPIGTGFLINTPGNRIALVTAKHVILNGDGSLKPNLAYRFNNKQTSSDLYHDSDLQTLAGGWFVSTNADVACRFIYWSDNSDILAAPFDKLLYQTNLEVGAPLLILGFPMGQRSEKYAVPIARHAMVARSEPDDLMIDGFVFPGNSGGPVFYCPYLEIGTNSPFLKPKFLDEKRIVGVVVDYLTYTDVAVSPQTQRPRVSFEENSGLCHAVPADKIVELLNRPDVAAFERPMPAKLK